MSFAVNGFEVVKQAITAETCELLAHQFEITKNIIYHSQGLNSASYLGDPQIEESFSWYGAVCFEGLLVHLKSQVEKTTGLELDPTYSYARIYYEQAELKRHRDRPSCQYSTTVCIRNGDTPWPIWIQDYAGNEHSVAMQPGDMLVYRGDQLDHWREPYQSTGQIQAFLHYVDRHGPYKHLRFDRRLGLGMPSVGPVYE